MYINIAIDTVDTGLVTQCNATGLKINVDCTKNNTRKLYYNFVDTTWHDYTEHKPDSLFFNCLRQNNLIIPCDKLGTTIERFYIIPKTHGGSIFKKIFNGILSFLKLIFKPIIKPINSIVNVILLIIKLLLYIGAFILWMIRLHVWFFLVFLPSLPADIMLLVKSLTYLLVESLTGWVMVMIRRLFNKFGVMTIKSIITGADNVPENDADEKNSQFFKDTETDDPNCGTGTKCYKTSEGTIPFSVIIATILCPPVGVFMEYGVTGWFNITICALLTLVFYFPGLIYALILLYC